MKHFYKIAQDIPVLPLLAQLDTHPGLWNAHTLRKAGASPHLEMSDIWVRYNDLARLTTREAFNDEHIPVWYPAWRTLTTLQPIVHSLMAGVAGEMLGGVLITKIPPGGGIAPHVDKGWHVEYFDKFYLSLRSSPGAKFICEHDGVKEELEPRPGEIWRFDNKKLHWVENTSTEDRITAIICIRTEMFWRLK